MEQYSQIILTFVVSLAAAIIAGPAVIPVLRRVKAGQSIREDGPQSHMSKAGTPTMGGFIMIIAVMIACLTVGGGINPDTLVMLAAFLAFAAIGFADDFVKVCMKRNLGLTAWQKLLLQIIIAVIISVYQAKIGGSTELYVPFTSGMYIDLGILYIPFVAFVAVAMSNAVNLTDGLDGLAAGTTMIAALTFALIGAKLGDALPAAFMAAVGGACLGFLAFNRNPAKVFMGDTGSLALGGALSSAAVLMKTELILPIAGGIFVIEVLSVVIQVVSYKTRKKRVFRMAPIHHHFELGGWNEKKVVRVFWLVTFILCLIALIPFMM